MRAKLQIFQNKGGVFILLCLFVPTVLEVAQDYILSLSLTVALGHLGGTPKRQLKLCFGGEENRILTKKQAKLPTEEAKNPH